MPAKGGFRWQLKQPKTTTNAEEQYMKPARSKEKGPAKALRGKSVRRKEGVILAVSCLATDLRLGGWREWGRPFWGII